jgi:hypothetical protein
MPLHLIKLCVGCDSIQDLLDWMAQRKREKRAAGQPIGHYHVTRMMPQRAEALLDGGSLYWIIKGNVQCRQSIMGLVPVTGQDGIARCKILMGDELVPTQWQPRRPFQGWRYLNPEDAPRDLGMGTGALAEMPDAMRKELLELGLL